MLTNLNSNQSFNGYLTVRLNNPAAANLPDKYYNEKVKIEEQKLDDKGKIIYHKKLPDLTLNTDKIVSVHSEYIEHAPSVGPEEDVYINISGNTRYVLHNVFKDDFDSKLGLAVRMPDRIIDLKV